MKDWGSEFAARQQALDAAANAAEQFRQQRAHEEQVNNNRVKSIIMGSVLPEFRNFAAGASQVTIASVKVEALRGDSPVPPEDEALERAQITGARVHITRDYEYQCTLKITSASNGELLAEIIDASGRSPPRREPLGKVLARGTVENLLRQLMDLALPAPK